MFKFNARVPLGRAYYQSLIEYSAKFFIDRINHEIARGRSSKTEEKENHRSRVSRASKRNQNPRANSKKWSVSWGTLFRIEALRSFRFSTRFSEKSKTYRVIRSLRERTSRTVDHSASTLQIRISNIIQSPAYNPRDMGFERGIVRARMQPSHHDELPSE